ncbi:hypothetical protein NDU88_006383 [Pleurodeles waltl]|uniref:Uncharacterized protein n=1 Tax=Pleurodeles waltl TaxID=8319 RepID=A0AAV7NUY9_PLEWA|nr:hypothetical protein NDU88_006383 [Pleurodeles waltl]
MGKTDKNQAKLQFDWRKTSGPAGEGAELEPEKGPDVSSGEEQDVRQILVVMQHSLTQIDGKIDSLSHRMDRMTERLGKHAEHLDQSDRRVSVVEDGQTELATSQLKLNKELTSLCLKVDDLEACSRRNNLRIVGIAESSAIDNMEGFIEQLLRSADSAVLVEVSPILTVGLSLQATAIKDFFQINKGSLGNVGVVWETFKVYIRGTTKAKHAGF